MKLKNLSIATLLLIIIGLGFSSCDEDREYRQASTFKVPFDAYANPQTGYFEETRRVRVDSEFFSNFSGRDEVRDIIFYTGWMEIANLVPDDRIYEINIAVNGNRVYRNFKGWSLGGKDYVWIGDDDLDHAIADILYSIGGNRWVDVTIYGKSNLEDRGPLEIDLFADVELLIRK